MKAWERDKSASDVYLKEIKQIIGAHLIGEPPVEEDQERNTDLIVLRMDAVRIACRVRTHDYLNKMNYRNEFTVRSSRPSGCKTELRKVIEGWGDYMFYGFGAADCSRLVCWNLLDLKVFRSAFFDMGLKGRVPSPISNYDKSSSFIPFAISDFPHELIIAKEEIE